MTHSEMKFARQFWENLLGKSHSFYTNGSSLPQEQ